MTKVAVFGLGLLGQPVAIRLADAGHDVSVWNRTPRKVEAVVARGARQASTPAEAARGAEVAITVLPTPEVLEQVVLGPDGIAESLSPGSLLVDMSTVGPDAIRALVGRLPDRVELVDAPVLGSVIQAKEGSLKVFVGGSDRAYEQLEPLFEVLGTPIHVGPLGAGAAMKLVVNSTLAPVMAAIGEALSLGDELGLDQGAVLDVLAGSAIGPSVKSKRERFETGVYEPNFRLEMARKDSDLINAAAGSRGRTLRLAALMRELLHEAEAAGLGDLDYSALVAHLRGTPASAPDRA